MQKLKDLLKNFTVYYWGTIDIIFTTASGVTWTLINFLLYGSTKSLSVIIQYNIAYFITLILAAFIVGRLSVILGPKVSYIIGRSSRIIVFAAVIFLSGMDIWFIYYLMGVLMGTSNSLMMQNRTVMDQVIAPDPDSYVTLVSFKNILFTALSFFSPILVNILYTDLTEIQALIAVIIVTVTLTSLTIPVSTERKQEEFWLTQMISKIFVDERYYKIFAIYFVMGVSNAFSAGVLSVLTLDVIGSVDGWTYVNIGLFIAGLIINWIFKKLRIGYNGITRVTISLGALIYGIFPMTLLFNFNLEIFLLFTFGKLIYDNVNSVALNTYVDQLERQDKHYDKHQSTYQLFNDVARYSGGALILGIILLIPQELLTNQVLTIILSLITIVPFLSIGLLRPPGMNVFKYNS